MVGKYGLYDKQCKVWCSRFCTPQVQIDRESRYVSGVWTNRNCFPISLKRKYHNLDDVIKWKYFPRNWPFVMGATGQQWIPLTKPLTRTLMFSLIGKASYAAVEITTFPMMTSSNGNIFRVTGHLCGEFTGPGEFPAQRPVTRSFDVFFDLRPNKRLSKQP